MERSPDSRRGRYFITDPFLRFFYRFLAAYQSKLALGKMDQTMQSIEQGLPQFIEDNTWQELCREWVLMASAHDELPIPIEEVGSEWKRTYAVDIVGVSYEDRTLILGSCHWGEETLGLEPVDELLRRTSSVIPDKEPWSVYYVGFSASGWNEEAHANADSMVKEYRPGRAKWQSVGIRLLSLEDVDADLARWTD